MSERDGNMELYKGELRGGRVHKHSLNRLTFHPSLQVSHVHEDSPVTHCLTRGCPFHAPWKGDFNAAVRVHFY